MNPAFVIASDYGSWKKFQVLHASLRKFHPDWPILLYSPEKMPVLDGCILKHVAGGEFWYVSCRPYMIQDGLKTNDAVIFLGADMELFAPLDCVRLLLLHDFIAVPHLCQPANNELDSAACGLLNTDFQMWRRCINTDKMLEWYCERVRRPCPVERRGIIDQFWLELLPALFPGCPIWRTMQHNVAYWNVREYGLHFHDGQWHTSGGTLVLYHYSGWVNSKILSQHKPEPTEGVIRQFYERYEALLNGVAA